MVTIARTRAIDRLRARASQDRTLAQSVAPSSAFSPAELAEGRQARERVQAALADLPAEQRRVLELAYFEGLSQSEIAKKTGDALGTVKTRVRLGMEKLSATLVELWRVDRP
jgi:RNA polymerase sigma-70 factor (ECF subfamily)